MLHGLIWFNHRRLKAIKGMCSHAIMNLVVKKPNSITLAGSKLVADQLRTSFEPYRPSVMEFGFNA